MPNRIDKAKALAVFSPTMAMPATCANSSLGTHLSYRLNGEVRFTPTRAVESFLKPLLNSGSTRTLDPPLGRSSTFRCGKSHPNAPGSVIVKKKNPGLLEG